MKNNLLMGIKLVVAAFLVISCNQESVVGESTPQVTNHEISINFFENTMSNIGEETRAGGSAKALQDGHRFSELEVALIPIDGDIESGYVIRQDSLEEDFGKVMLEVPAGDYHMVAVAAATAMPFTKRIDIKSASEVRFPDDKPTDMVYVYKDISVKNNTSHQAINATMSRGVSGFKLISTDCPPSNLAMEEIEIKGNCGVVFNPSTGKCKEETTILKKITVNSSALKYRTLTFKVFAFLNDTDVSNLSVTAQAKDKEGKIIRECKFDNVHLEIGKYTNYTGAVFTNDNSISFEISNPDWEDSEYSQSF